MARLYLIKNVPEVEFRLYLCDRMRYFIRSSTQALFTWRKNDVRVEGLLAYSRANFIHFLRLGESFTLEQKGGSIKMLTRLAGLPFLEDRVTLRAGQLFFI